MAGGLFVYMGRGDQRREVKLGIQCLAEGARLMPWTDGGADPMFRDLFYAVIMQKLGVETSPPHPPPPRTEDFQIAYLYIETNMHLFGSSSSIYHNFRISKRRRIDEVI
jgi:hypothetical protein